MWLSLGSLTALTAPRPSTHEGRGIEAEPPNAEDDDLDATGRLYAPPSAVALSAPARPRPARLQRSPTAPSNQEVISSSRPSCRQPNTALSRRSSSSQPRLVAELVSSVVSRGSSADTGTPRRLAPRTSTANGIGRSSGLRLARHRLHGPRRPLYDRPPRRYYSGLGAGYVCTLTCSSASRQKTNYVGQRFSTRMALHPRSFLRTPKLVSGYARVKPGFYLKEPIPVPVPAPRVERPKGNLLSRFLTVDTSITVKQGITYARARFSLSSAWFRDWAD